MSVVEVRHVLNTAYIATLLHSPTGAVARSMVRRGAAVEAVAKSRVRVDTGRLRDSIHTRLIIVAGVPIAEVGSELNYALYQEVGTGIYGPRGQRIVPRHGTYLVFMSKTTGKLVFAKSVAGTPAQPYLRPALPAARTAL